MREMRHFLKNKMFSEEFMGLNLQITNSVCLVYLRQDHAILNWYSLPTIMGFNNVFKSQFFPNHLQGYGHE